jgi:hypothetical protein
MASAATRSNNIPKPFRLPAHPTFTISPFLEKSIVLKKLNAGDDAMVNLMEAAG